MVIGPEITSSSLRKSARAARGRPQLATYVWEVSGLIWGCRASITDWSPEMCACDNAVSEGSGGRETETH